MYKALYRKWRPQTFRDVVGQEAITGALESQIESGRVGHAYLFTGTRGTGKTTCAKVLAKTVNCENRTEDGPCGECPCCKGIEDGSIFDVIEIDAASNNGVDDVRDLRDETVYRPGRCQYKVYIIDEVHMLSVQAFNALLKILEEPPSHVIFILATTEIHKVPATILSRCQRYDFTRIPAGKIAERLRLVAAEEGIDLSEGAADLVAVLGDGSMRDALSLLDTCAAFGEAVDEELVRRMAGVTDQSYLFSLSDAAAGGDLHKLLTLVASLREQSIDVKRLAEELVAHYRNFLLASAEPDGSLLSALPADEQKRYLEAAGNKTDRQAVAALHRLADALDRMGRSQDPRVELELALFDIAAKAAGQAQTEPLAASVAAVPKVEAKPVAPSPSVAPPPVSNTPSIPATPPEEVKKEILPPATPAAAVVATAPAAPVEKLPVPEPFGQWDEVVAAVNQMDVMVYSYLKPTKAYFDGARVLIDGGEMFLEFMRSNKNVSEIIKKALENTCGRRYGIGPYKVAGKQETPEEISKKNIQEWQAKGVPIEYENETVE